MFNGLTLRGGIVDGKQIRPTDILENLFYCAALKSDKLMKLKLTKMDLRNDALIANIGQMLYYNRNMVLLDVSMGGLLAKQLNDLSAQLAEKGMNIRNLNLSYNILDF